VSAAEPLEPLEVVAVPARAVALLHPVRAELLEHLQEPDSASGLARRLDRPRQTVNYHLRELEREGLVGLVGERRRGSVTERLVRATARSYLIDPDALGPVGARPGDIRDRFSAAYLLATAAQVIRDLALLHRRATQAGKRLATFTLETELGFASAADRRAFTEELATEVARLVVKHADDRAPTRRRFRLVIGAYPSPPEQEAEV
jgi:DNA-binding transcriptional ArsR family regulator